MKTFKEHLIENKHEGIHAIEYEDSLGKKNTHYVHIPDAKSHHEVHKAIHGHLVNMGHSKHKATRLLHKMHNEHQDSHSALDEPKKNKKYPSTPLKKHAENTATLINDLYGHY